MGFNEKYAWSRKSKKYKDKYFKALGQLFGDTNDKDCHKEGCTHGRPGTDKTSHLVDKAGD